MRRIAILTVVGGLLAGCAQPTTPEEAAQRAAFIQAMYGLQGAGQAIQAATPPVPQPQPIYVAPAQPLNCRTVFIGDIARTQCF